MQTLNESVVHGHVLDLGRIVAKLERFEDERATAASRHIANAINALRGSDSSETAGSSETAETPEAAPATPAVEQPKDEEGNPLPPPDQMQLPGFNQ